MNHIIVTSFLGSGDDRHRSEDSIYIGGLFKKHGMRSAEVIPNSKEALDKLLARPEPILLVTGSFYLLNEIRPLLKNMQF
jgi:hypothetical protein